jgi:hypothetical protein
MDSNCAMPTPSKNRDGKKRKASIYPRMYKIYGEEPGSRFTAKQISELHKVRFSASDIDAMNNNISVVQNIYRKSTRVAKRRVFEQLLACAKVYCPDVTLEPAELVQRYTEKYYARTGVDCLAQFTLLDSSRCLLLDELKRIMHNDNLTVLTLNVVINHACEQLDKDFQISEREQARLYERAKRSQDEAYDTQLAAQRPRREYNTLTQS